MSGSVGFGSVIEVVEISVDNPITVILVNEGLPGADGAVGPLGPLGPRGFVGETGATGATGSAGNFVTVQDDFVATEAQTVFTLSNLRRGNAALVSINGLIQPKTEYDSTSTQITFHDGVGISSGDIISVFYLT